jgi:hypothetical protein
VSRALLALNVLLAALAVFAGVTIARELTTPRSLPKRAPAPVTAAAAPAPRATDAGKADQRPTYNVIPARNLFSASRTESAVDATVAAAPAPKLFLHGVIVDEGRSRAFIEDPVAKRTFSYAVGDTVGGGKLEMVRSDRIVIARPEGKMEVMLRDPAKPQPTATPGAPGAAAPTAPGLVPPRPVPLSAGRPVPPMPVPSGAPLPPAPGVEAPVPAVPPATPGPRLLRPDLLRIPTGPTPSVEPARPDGGG